MLTPEGLPVNLGWFLGVDPVSKRAAELLRHNLEFIHRENRFLSAGLDPAAHLCPDCGRKVYLRWGRSGEGIRAHRAWAHPVYKTRLQSIQETGRRPGHRKPFLERLATDVERWWAGR